MDAGGRLRRDVHVAARHHDRECRAAEGRSDDLHGSFLRHPVGDRRLRADTRVAAADGRDARRPVRAAAAVRDRPAAVRGASLLCGAVAECAVPEPGARGGRGSGARSCSPPRWRCWPRSSTAASAAPHWDLGRDDRRRRRDRPALGGILTEGFGWESIFYINVPIGIVAAFLTMTKVAESRNPQASRIDWIGTVTFTGGAVPARPRPDPWQRGGLGECADRWSVRRLRGAAGRIRGRRARPETADV